jgi:hypothetical protein
MVDLIEFQAFLDGDRVSAETLAEIERDLNDPKSMVRKIGRELAQASRMLLDPESPPFAGPLRMPAGKGRLPND